MGKKNRIKKSARIKAEQSLQLKAGAINRPGSSRLKTCVFFLGYMVFFHVILNVYANFNQLPLREETANIVSSILNSIGIKNSVIRDTIFLHYDKWVVTGECTAISVVFLFVSFVLAYPTSIKAKVFALIPGIPVIFVTNIIRLVVLGWVTEFWPNNAHFIHDYVWESIFLIFIVALWVIWLKLVVNRENATAVSC